MKVKKMFTMMTAVVSTVVSMGSVSAFAIDDSFMESFNHRVQYPSQEELAMFEAEMAAEDPYAVSVASSTETSFYYAPYDSYSETSLANSTHYIAVLTANPSSTSTDPVPLRNSQNIYFYLNANLMAGNYANPSNVIAGYDYSNYITVGSSYVTTINNDCVRLSVGVSTSDNASVITDAVRYKMNFAEGGMASIGGEDGASEATLNAETSPDYEEDDITIDTSIRGLKFTKCLYALGDLNRDGSVDSNDSSIMESFMVNLGAPNPSRSEKEQQCDVVAFGLAADCNQDNVVNLFDAIYLNHHLADPENYPL
ncbi:MAG: dockerin type I repeat-containing protein [Ruminococcus sp.]